MGGFCSRVDRRSTGSVATVEHCGAGGTASNAVGKGPGETYVDVSCVGVPFRETEGRVWVLCGGAQLNGISLSSSGGDTCDAGKFTLLKKLEFLVT